MEQTNKQTYSQFKKTVKKYKNGLYIIGKIDSGAPTGILPWETENLKIYWTPC